MSAGNIKLFFQVLFRNQQTVMCLCSCILFCWSRVSKHTADGKIYTSLQNSLNKTVFFLKSSSQLTLLSNMTMASQSTLRLPSSEAVHPIMTFDPNDRNFLYVMTSHHVRAPQRSNSHLFMLSENCKKKCRFAFIHQICPTSF